MSASPMFKYGSGTNDNDNIFGADIDIDAFDTFQLSSTAGAMDVFVSANGANFLTAPLALIDLGSTDPSTAVIVTTAGGNYGIKGRWKKMRVLQNGATAVANATLTGYIG